MSTNPAQGGTKTALGAAQKIVAELQGMPIEDQARALRFATEELKIPQDTRQTTPRQATLQEPDVLRPAPSAPANSSRRVTDIKSFTETKAPKTDQQFATVVAYFYQFEAPDDQKRDSVDAATLTDAARLAGRKQVNNWGNTLDNARRSGFLDKSERGTYKLNAVGENLVAITLPDNASPRNSIGSKKKVPKKKAAKKESLQD